MVAIGNVNPYENPVSAVQSVNKNPFNTEQRPNIDSAAIQAKNENPALMDKNNEEHTGKMFIG